MEEKNRNLAESLRSIRAARGLSLEEFAKELDIPRTTLNSILTGGQTTLHTAIHISEKLGVPLDTLTNGTLEVNQIKRMESFVSQLKWYDRLPNEKKNEAREHMLALIKIMEEGAEEPSP